VAGTIHLFVLYYEEPTLSQRYGEEYEEFKRMVPRWLPRLTPWKSYETRSSGTKS